MEITIKQVGGQHVQEIDYRDVLNDLRNQTAIRVGKIECVKRYYQRGFPLKQYVQRLKDNTITVYEFRRLNEHIDKIAAQPIETFYAK